MQPEYLIVALSARALAQSAARAGYRVHAIDLFGDEDTGSHCASVAVAPPLNGGFDAARLPALVAHAREEHDIAGVVYGSGFEDRIEVLSWLYSNCPLLGNSPKSVRATKDPETFFPLLEKLDIPHPETAWSGVADEDGWLEKARGGGGGGHVHALAPRAALRAGCYRQRRIAGRSMSAVFLADGRRALLLGMSEHWCAQPELLTPFQHSGMVRVHPSRSLSSTIEAWISRLVDALALRGLCGIDFVVTPNGAPLLLEINPRPPASFELFEAADSLFTAHLAACGGELRRPMVEESVRASAVVYAPCEWQIPALWSWPSWTSDRTAAGVCIARGQPLCTVSAQGETSAAAIAQVQQCLRDLTASAVGPE